MAGTANLKGTNITVLDTLNPFSQLTAGEGRGARLKQVEDVVAIAGADLEGTDTYVRLCRIPATAKVKKVELWTDVAPDDEDDLILTVGVGWSDSTIDGTPTAYQGKAPAAAKDGTNTAATTNNALYGTLPFTDLDNLPLPITEVTLKGSVVTDLLAKVQQPLAKLFAFVTGQGQDSAPGYMDIIVSVTTAAGAGHGNATKLGCRVQYAE